MPETPDFPEPLFDVVAVNIATGKERFIAKRKTERSAEAIIRFSVIARGVDVEFFKAVPHAPETTHA